MDLYMNRTVDLFMNTSILPNNAPLVPFPHAPAGTLPGPGPVGATLPMTTQDRVMRDLDYTLPKLHRLDRF